MTSGRLQQKREKAISDTNVELLGVQSDPIEIYSITNMLNNATDGSISKGWNIELKGSYLRIAGDHPDCGIQFRNTNNGEIYKLPAQNIVLNDPSRLLLLIPMELEAGDYELTVTTQYTKGTSLLKSPRSATYHVPLAIS